MTPTTALVPFKELDAEQIALVKRTVAVGATDDELALFFFDCQRRGVHPLDKLIYFTKRKGKYTPLTSIDFFRTRAHDTGKCAGITDPVCVGEPKKPGFAATVTVRRLVDGIVAEFTATARWDEYKPDENDFMWRKMPFTMLGKCAEALALRKAFPHELAGLYTGDEMAQAGKSDATTETVNTATGEIVEAAPHTSRDDMAASNRVVERELLPDDPPSVWTGVIACMPSREETNRRTGGKFIIFDFKVDEQVMSTTNKGIAEKVAAFAGQRATVTYKHAPSGALTIKSIAAETVDETQSEPDWGGQ